MDNTFAIRPKNSYNISTKEFLEKYTDNESAIENLIILVRDGTIWFPFQKHFNKIPLLTLFENLKNINLPVYNLPYKLYSYYPKYGSYLPPKFRGNPTIINFMKGTYETADILSDLFIENIRLKAKRYNQEYSIIECWNIDSCIKEILKTVLHKDVITPQTLRSSIYETIAETQIFNPTWARALLKLVMGDDLSGKKWLDISSGWGDRLLTAMSLDMNYLGFDPNIELQTGHSEMIENFGDHLKHKIIYQPFETEEITDGPYDVVLSSPPYFNVEEYSPQQKGQSIVSYPNFNTWMVSFLYTALSKAWDNLKEGGYLILHLGDAKTIITSEATNIFIENYLPGAFWEGVIGLQSRSGYHRPVWVWKKLSYKIHEDINFSRRTLYYTYPEIHSELLRYHAAKHAPDYLIRRSSVNDIRDNISLHISREIIDSVLSDDLMISSLLETQGANGTILYLINNIGDLSEINVLAPYYKIRKNNAINIRGHVSKYLPSDIINSILSDDLMISSLLETIGIEGTIDFAVTMIKLALHI